MGRKSSSDCLQNILTRACCYFELTFTVCFGLNGRSAGMCQLNAGTRHSRAGCIGYGPRDNRKCRPGLGIARGHDCDDERGKATFDAAA